jgi:hypothetical protein
VDSKPTADATVISARIEFGIGRLTHLSESTVTALVDRRSVTACRGHHRSQRRLSAILAVREEDAGAAAGEAKTTSATKTSQTAARKDELQARRDAVVRSGHYASSAERLQRAPPAHIRRTLAVDRFRRRPSA